MSVASRVWWKWPLLSPPSWLTRSISMNPGLVSSHSCQVLSGICDFSRLPGRVIERPLPATSPLRCPASRRSIVAGDIASSATWTSSSMPSSPCARSDGTRVGRAGPRIFPEGPASTAQQTARASMTSGPYRYTGPRGFRGCGSCPAIAYRSALRAWSRCQPVTWQTASNTCAFSALVPLRYRLTCALVTCRRAANVSSILHARPRGHPG